MFSIRLALTPDKITQWIWEVFRGNELLAHGKADTSAIAMRSATKIYGEFYYAARECELDRS